MVKDYPKVLFISAEVAPFAKVGGLADVAGALPRALVKLGVDARVCMPLYKKIRERYRDRLEFVRWTMIRLGWRTVYSGLFKMEYEGVIYYFIDNEYYFGHDAIYLNYDFDIERFCFFQRAVLEAMGNPMDFTPDILHCNDWQTGLIPCLLEAHYKPYGYYRHVSCMYTIHNLKYQGLHAYEKIADYCDLSPNFLNDFGVLQNGVPNMMKAGIVYAQEVTTVSPTYAQEIMSDYFGEGLNHLLHHYSYKVSGILNGIDDIEYNPQKDSNLPKQYSVKTYAEGKAANKKVLQSRVGLPEKEDVPVFGMVTRLVDQKGLDLLLHVIDDMAQLDLQIVVLGTGDAQYEQALYQASQRYPEKIAACLCFDNALAHLIYAGCDAFLMPSIFEPCGLSQLISMAYGTLPIVRETGGLKDTVAPYNRFTGEGTGFSFSNINAHEFLFTLQSAYEVYRNQPQAWAKMVEEAMNGDYSWKYSAQKYLELYERARHD